MESKRITSCETTAAITIHARELQENEEPCYTGRKRKDAATLCGKEVGWDCKFALFQIRCKECLEKMKLFTPIAVNTDRKQ